MPKTRCIDPAFWDDLDVRSLNRYERLLLLAMMTVCADDYGRLVADPGYLRKMAFGYDDDMDTPMVAEMRDHIVAKCHNVRLYIVAGQDYIHLVNFEDYQHIKYKVASKLPAPPDFAPVPPTSPQIAETCGNSAQIASDVELSGVDVEQSRVGVEVEQPRASAPTPPPIVIFRELTHSCPAPGTPMWDAIASLPAANGHMDTWRQVIQEWMLRGFKTRNIAGMLDWYHNGIPPRGPVITAGQRARAAPRGPDPDLHAAAIAGERYRAQLEEQHDHPA